MDKVTLEHAVTHFIATYPERHPVLTRWRDPIVGYAAAGDPLFTHLKEVIRPSHATPDELLPGAKTVIVYFVPFAEALHRENARAGHYAARSWAVAYVETNRLIVETSEALAGQLRGAGYRAVTIPPTHNFDEVSLLSDWSVRHAAYAAGIGRLGVHNLLITEKGCTGRLGSLVTDLELEPTLPPQGEFCLHKAGRKCLKCVERCRYGALRVDGFDRHACYRQCLANDRYHADLPLSDVCGKCAAGVPCSTTNPLHSRSKAEAGA